MNTLEAIAKRVSVRAYKPEQITEEELAVILKAGMAAPVAMANYDSLHITVIQNEKMIARIFDQAQQAVFAALGVNKSMNYGAKTLIVISSLPPHREGMDYANGGIIIENMVLAATELGVDSCIMGAPIAALAGSRELCEAVGIPEGFKPLVGSVFGYGTVETPVKSHRIAVNRV